jgi:UPF0716 protein FxsA
MQTQKQTIPALGLILFAALVAVPLAEIALFVELGGRIGLWPTLALIVLTALVGAWMLRWQGFATLARARRQLAEGALPVAEVFEGLCLLVAGALLLTPGFLTDAVGALLLLRPVRLMLYRRVARHLDVHVGGAGRHDAAEPHVGAGPIIEAQFEEVETRPKAPPSAGADPTRDVTEDAQSPEMPPPRGGWDRGR